MFARLFARLPAAEILARANLRSCTGPAVIVKDGSDVVDEIGQRVRGAPDLFGLSVFVPFVFFTIHERADLFQTVFTSIACSVPCR